MTGHARRSSTVAAGVVAVCAFVLLNLPAMRAPYDWDEIDYVEASRLGVKANLLDTESLSAADFWRFALGKLRGLDVPLPAGYDEETDPLLRRHYHPPAIVALLGLIPVDRPEWALRLVQVAGGILLIAIMVSAYTRGTSESTAAGLVTITLLAAWAAIVGFGSIAFHGWAALCSTALVTLLCAWLRHPLRRTAVASGIVLGLAALVLETAAIVATLAMAVLWWRSTASKRDSWQAIGIVLAVALAVVVLAWPGSILKASLVKIPALYLYRIRLGQEYADVPGRLATVALVMAPGLVALGILAATAPRIAVAARDRLWPFAVVGSAYAIALLPFALNPVYLLPGVAPLAVAAAIAVNGSRRGVWQWALAGLIAASIVMSGGRVMADRALLVREDERQLAALVSGRRAYVDGAHIYRFYLGPQVPLEPLTLSPDLRELTTRRNGVYVPITSSDLKGSLVLIQKRRFPGHQLSGLLMSCRAREETATLRVFDCE